MKNYFLTIFVIISIAAVLPPASATAISMGNGKDWLDICSGNSKDYPGRKGEGRCELLLFSYMMGVARQAFETKQEPIYCGPRPGSVREQLVDYLRQNPSELDKEFLDVIHRFLNSSCEEND